MSILIKKGRVIDPQQGLDKVMDILIEGGKISKVGAAGKASVATVIDAGGKIVAPGFIDMHTHLREPGNEDKETIETGLRAAIAGGFTTVCAMPNTEPSCDNQAQIKFLTEKAKTLHSANLIPVGTITKGRQGKEITEMNDLKDAGCPAVSDDGSSVEDPGLMRKALEYASMTDMLVISHAEDKSLAGDGVMHEGYWSTVLGLSPVPSKAESTIVERDIQLAQLAGARIHIAHVSAAESVEIIRRAKKEGIPVTCEVAPHHFSLTDEDVKTYDTSMKVNPPLRSKEDIKAIKKGLKDGTIDVIATDHAPHLDSEKDKEFDYAPFGMIGLETALSLSVINLVEEGCLDWEELIRKLATNPAMILKHDRGTLLEGAVADVVIIDPDKEWTYERENIISKSANSPFIGKKMKGFVESVIVGGKIVKQEGKILA
jgi:dihydroorotase